MAKPDADQLAALEELRRLDPTLEIEWDEDTGTPKFIRGLLSRPLALSATYAIADAAPESALAFLTQNRALYQLKDPRDEFPRSRVVSDEHGNTVHLYQVYQGVEVLDGELSVAVDAHSQVTQVMGRYRPSLDLSTAPTLSAEEATQRALSDLAVEDKNLEPIAQRLLIATPRSLGATSTNRAVLTWRIDLQDWVYFVDAHTGAVLLSYDNKQTTRNRETYSTANCRLLPGTLWLNEAGPVAGQPVDQIALSAHQHAGAVYDYYMARFRLDSIDGKGRKLVSTVHSGVNNGFTCDQNNAAFLPSVQQIVFGDGDGVRFGPFAYALDVVAHEWQHAVTYFAITWSDGTPRGLDYRDESGALNESYSDFFGALVEGRDWFLGEDCYTPNTPDDALRDMANPGLHGQPDHYSKYVTTGTQSYRVHVNSGIMNKAAYLMCEGGSHYGITVAALGKEAVSSIWYRAMVHHLQGASTFAAARSALLQSCQELYPQDTAKYAAVQNACAAVGVGEAAAPVPNIVVDPAKLDFGSVTMGQTAKINLSIQNKGDAELSVSAIELVAGPFSASGEAAFRLAAGVSRSLSVSFSPVQPGPQQASLIIRSNDQDQPTVTVPLTGLGAGVPAIAVEPTLLNFGTVVLGQSTQLPVTVRNSGTAALVVSDVHTDLGIFALSGETTFQLPPGASKAVAVRFSPHSVGTQEATLTIVSNDPAHGTVNLDLLGAGLGVPVIATEPLSVDFGETAIGQSSERTVTVHNSGSLTLMISKMRIDRAVFSTSDDPSFALAPGTSQKLTIRFSPVAVGPIQATLSLDSNDNHQPTVNISLAGMGVAVPYISVEPDHLDLGTVSVGHSSQDSLTVRNIGSADLSVSAIELVLSPFLISGDTTFTLAPAESRMIMVHFNPTRAGSVQADLTIRSNDPDRPALVADLRGLGVAVPQIAVEPITVTFGSVMLGQSAERSLAVRNSGSAELVIAAITVPAGEFSLQGETSFRLEPTGTKTLALAFIPTAIGTKQKSLIIQSNDPDRPQLSVELQAQALGIPHLHVEPAEVDFGAVAVGQSARQSLKVRNSGSADLSVSVAKPATGPFSLTGEAEFIVAPAESREVLLVYAPTKPELHKTTLSIRSSDPDQPSLAVPLSGSGVGIPQIAVEPGQLDWGTITLGQSVERSVILRNPGSADLLVSSIQCDRPDFSISGATSFAIAPGTTRALAVAFSPTAPGALSATLSIHSNAQGYPALHIPFTATVAGVSDIRVEPAQIDFGTVLLGQAVQRPLTVSNVGTADLTVSNIELPAGPFRLMDPASFVLAPGIAHVVNIEFVAAVLGVQRSTLTIHSTDLDQPSWTISLGAQCVGVPHVSLSPTQLEFGPVALGLSPQQTLSIHNTGSADLTISKIQLPDGPFALAGETPFTVAPAASRDIQVTYRPRAPGAHTAVVTFWSDDPAQPTLTASLAGSGVAVAKISVKPSALDFGAVNLGERLGIDLLISSTGSADLEVSGIDLSAGSFACGSETSFVVPSGSSHGVTVTYTPETVGASQSTLTIRSNDASQPKLSVSLSGSGTAVPRISVEPASLDFGSLHIGGSLERTLTVHNMGSAELTVSNVELSTGPFVRTGEAAFAVRPSGSHSITVAFAPTGIGLHQATLTLRSNDPSQPTLVVHLNGTGTAVARLSVEPASLDFGSILLGATAQRGVTVTNTGSAELLVDRIEFSDPSFALDGETAFRLAPAASRNLSIRFTPAVVGPSEAAMTIHCSAIEQPSFRIDLHAAVVGTPKIAVEPATMSFGTVTVGQSSHKVLIVRDVGSAELRVSAVDLPTGPFSVAGEHDFRLTPAQSHEITVTFMPTEVGQREASLTIHSDDATQAVLTVPLEGIAVGVPQIAVEPTQLEWGTITVGQSVERSLTLRNPGSADLLISSVQCSNTVFVVSGATVFALAPQTARALSLVFSPAAIGAVQATLTIHSNAQDTPALDVLLSAAVAGPSDIRVEPAQVDFGAVLLGQTTQRTLTVSNLGAADLIVSSIDVPDGSFHLSSDAAFSLPSGAMKTVAISYSPETLGSHQATLTIHSSDPDRPEWSIVLTGSGVGIPRIEVAPQVLDFGAVDVGDSASLNLALRNAGTANLTITEIDCPTGPFSIAGNLPFELAPGTLRELTVTYAPTEAATHQGQLTIRSSDQDQPASHVSLRGTSLGVPQIIVEPASLDFGTVVLGQSAERALTINNAGTANLVILGIEVSGGEFELGEDTSFVLRPAVSRTLGIQFHPSAPGAQHAMLTIRSNDAEQPLLTVPLQSDCIGIPSIGVSPAGLDFGCIHLGQRSQLALGILNTGTADLTVSEVRCDDVSFFVEGQTSFRLAPGSERSLTVSFLPAASGAHEAKLIIRCDDPDRPTLLVTLSANAVGVPLLTIEPTQLEWGTITVGQSIKRFITLRNPGSADLLVAAIECNSRKFTVPEVDSFVLAPQASKNLAVGFEADTAGFFEATLTIRSNAHEQPTVLIQLSAMVVGESDIRVDPAQIDFGHVLLGETAQHILSIRNAGNTDLTVSAVAVPSGPFHLPASTAFTVIPGASHDITVFFSPEVVGAQQATLTLHSSDPNHPTWSVILFGSGSGIPRLAITPQALDFGTIALGQSPQNTLTLRNVGSGELLVSAIQSSQPAFSVSGQTRFGLEPDAQHATLIQFTALTAGQQRGTVTISSNDSGQPEMAVPASGYVAEGPKIVTEPTSLDFGMVAPGSSSTGLSLTIRNLGGDVLKVTGIGVERAVPSDAAASFHILGNAVFDLQPGDSGVVALRFVPGIQGAQRAVLSIQSNDSRWPVLPVDMTGVCEAALPQGPHIVLQPQQLDFGSVPLGQTSRRDLTLRNTGTEVLRVAGTTINCAVFSLVGEGALVLQPSECHALTLEYRPISAGAERGSLTISSNDPQSPETTATLYGASTNCAAATAAYGSPLQKDLHTLRTLRDETMVRSPVGRLAVQVYYFWSPRVASWIASSPGRRAAARTALRPALSLARLLVARTDDPIGEAGDSSHRHPPSG
jgi:Zn-dependent metalloprotease